MKFICLAGPTGAGKSAMALELARRFALLGRPAMVMNADSRQVYADFPVITAQPTKAEQALCPHLLYGYLPSDQKNSAGQWADSARAAMAAHSGFIPLVTGGTGLYLRTLQNGIVDIPPCDAAILARLKEECALYGPAPLHESLVKADPAYAARIHPNDRQRVMRALEVWEGTGKTFSWWHEHQAPPPQSETLRLGIGMPLAELTPRLVARNRAMLEAGALAEATAALARCPNTAAPGWNGIGCAELAAHLQGGLDLEETLALWDKNTRAYAKRQITWFRADPLICWFRPEDAEGVWQAASAFLEE